MYEWLLGGKLYNAGSHFYSQSTALKRIIHSSFSRPLFHEENKENQEGGTTKFHQAFK